MIKLKNILNEDEETPETPKKGVACYEWMTGFVNGTYQVKSTDMAPNGVYTLKFAVNTIADLKKFCDGDIIELPITCVVTQGTVPNEKSVDPLQSVKTIKLSFKHYDVKSYDDESAQKIGGNKLWKFFISSTKYIIGDTFTIDGDLSDVIFDTTEDSNSVLSKSICELIVDNLIWYAIKGKKILKYSNLNYNKYATNYRVITNTYGTQKAYPTAPPPVAVARPTSTVTTLDKDGTQSAASVAAHGQMRGADVARSGGGSTDIQKKRKKKMDQAKRERE